MWRAGYYNFLFLTVVGGLFALFAPALARLFTADEAVIPIATGCLRIVSFGFPSTLMAWC